MVLTIEYILGIVSFTIGLIGTIWQFVKNRTFMKHKLSAQDTYVLTNLYNYVLNIVSNYEALSIEGKAALGLKLIKKGIEGIGRLDSVENKQLNKFIEYINGTRTVFNLDAYKMDLIETLTTLQKSKHYMSSVV